VKIGVLGAGQLGRMLALAGYPLDFDFIFLDPAREACAAALGDHLCADYSDEEMLSRLCAGCDLVTYEFENVPARAAEFVAARRPLYPPVAALVGGQDRLSEKSLFTRLGIATPKYRAIDSREALHSALNEIGLPAVLKTRRLGYDGKGQAMLRSASDADAAWQRLGSQPLILESFVAFERELSIIAVRSRTGELAFYPVVENVHRDGILRTARPRANDRFQGLAEDYATRVLSAFDYVGVLAFEFFCKGDQLLANEIAPRVHNSGHWTIEGAQCSQFENHLRAICGLPLGSTELRGSCALVNFIGAAPALSTIAALGRVHAHLYGKSPKPQRKVGHATAVCRNEAELEAALPALQRLADAAGSS
jgi:5-(carboxyamino)imidazole ribonucleotide synthase